MSKKTLVEKILTLIKGGDSAKLMRFESKLNKYITKQIQTRKDEVENLQEKVVDAKEELNDTILNVSADSIQNADNVESYCKTYAERVLSKIDNIDTLQEKIAEINEQIDRLNSLSAAVDAVEVKEVVETTK